VYKPSKRIVAQLKAYDPGLDVVWDAMRERWAVTWRGAVVHHVRNEDGSYRPLDERVVTHVALIDACRYSSAQAFMREITEHNHRLEERAQAKFSDHVQQVAKEDIYRAVFGSPLVPVGVDMETLK